MKKSLVAVSIVVVLGAAWTGASWYTGKLIEQRMGEIVDTANAQLKNYQPKAGLKLSYENYQRGIFSSKFRYVLRADNIAGDSFLKAGEEIAFNETADHGPFPLAQLKKLNLIPSLASLHTELENTPKVRELFEITKGKPLFSADSRISYSGSTASAIDLIPVEYQKDKTTLQFSGAKFDVDIGSDMQTMNLSGDSDSVTITAPNEMGQNERLVLQGLTLKSNTHKNENALSLGDQVLGVKQIALALDNQDAVTLDNFQLVSHFGEKDGNLNGQLDYTLDALKVKGNDFGSAKLTLKIDKLDGKALKAFSERYNSQLMALLQQEDALDPLVYQQRSREILAQNLPLLLKSNPSISVAPLSWKNAKGESTLTLNLDLNDAAQSKTSLTGPLKKLDANLNVPMAMLKEISLQVAKVQGYSAEDAQKLAQQQVQGFVAMVQMFKVTTLKDDVLGSSIHYADNQVELNGNKMPLQTFLSMFGLPSNPEPAAQAPAPVDEHVDEHLVPTK